MEKALFQEVIEMIVTLSHSTFSAVSTQVHEISK